MSRPNRETPSLFKEPIVFGCWADGVVNDEVGAFNDNGQAEIVPGAERRRGELERPAGVNGRPGDAQLVTGPTLDGQFGKDRGAGRHLHDAGKTAAARR